MEHFTDVILKLIDRFPTWYLMVVVSVAIFYKLFSNLCKKEHLLTAKILSKWKVKIDTNIKTRLDNLENKIKKNTDSINDICDLLKNKE